MLGIAVRLQCVCGCVYAIQSSSESCLKHLRMFKRVIKSTGENNNKNLWGRERSGKNTQQHLCISRYYVGRLGRHTLSVISHFEYPSFSVIPLHNLGTKPPCGLGIMCFVKSEQCFFMLGSELCKYSTKVCLWSQRQICCQL